MEDKKNLDLSALEFLAYEREMNQAIEAYKKFEKENPLASDEKRQQMRRKLLNAPERKIRASHKKKDSMLEELKNKTAGRKIKSDQTAVEGIGKAKIKIEAIKKCANLTKIDEKRLMVILGPDGTPSNPEKTLLSQVPKETLEKATQEAIAHDDLLSELHL